MLNIEREWKSTDINQGIPIRLSDNEAEYLDKSEPKLKEEKRTFSGKIGISLAN